MTITEELRGKCAWCNNCSECRDLQERAAVEIERLQAIVDRLPKTADGVPVAFHQELWYFDRDSDNPIRLMHTRTLSYWKIVESCYSTREAAESARKANP